MDRLIRDWLYELPREIANDAITNAKAAGSLHEPNVSLLDTLYSAFDWENTVQGAAYWSYVRSCICSGEVPMSFREAELEYEYYLAQRNEPC